MLAATDPAVALGVAAIAPSVPGLTPAHPNYRLYPSLEPLDTDEGWAKWNVHYWRRDYRGFLEFFFSQQLPEPHSTKQIEDCRRAGGSTAARTRSSSPTRRRRRRSRARRRRASICRRVRCPVLVHPRRPRQLPDARACDRGGGADRRDARHARGRGPPAAGAPPGQGERPPEGLRRRGRAAGAEGEDVDAGAQPAPPRALRLVADRARPRPSRRRDRAGAAEAPPRPRDRLARAAPGDGGARGRGRADPPGERAARERVGAHRVRVGRARPARLPGDPADGRDPRRELHALPRRRARGAATTSGSATRPGRSTTSCTRTRS